MTDTPQQTTQAAPDTLPANFFSQPQQATPSASTPQSAPDTLPADFFSGSHSQSSTSSAVPQTLSANGQSLPPQTGQAGLMSPEAEAASKEAAGKWYNQDSSGHPVTGDENGQIHTIRANDPTNAGTAVARWAEQVSNDVKYGTDFTGIGKVLKRLGAHGVDVGNSQAVGDWMASIPLGLLRLTKGAGEANGSQSSGGNWQAAKDLAGGVAQATEMPTAVIAPESPELEGAAGAAVNKASKLVSAGADAAKSVAGKAVDTAGSAVNAVGKGAGKVVSIPGKVAEKVAPGIYPPEIKLPTPAEARQASQPVFDALHQQVRDAVAAAAQDAGVAVKDTDSIQDVAANAAKAMKAKASKLYAQIDDALTAMADDGGDMRGRYQAIDENIDKLQKKVADAIGEPEKQQQFQEALDAEKVKKQAVADKLKEAGLEHLPERASALHKQASAMEDFGQKVQQNTNGLPGHPDIPERLNPHTFANSLKNLKNSTDFGGNRLKQALGDYAETLIQQTNDAKAALQKIKDEAVETAKQAADAAAKRARVKGAALTAAGLEGAHKAYNLFTGE